MRKMICDHAGDHCKKNKLCFHIGEHDEQLGCDGEGCESECLLFGPDVITKCKPVEEE